ncbi:hypothetical protein [Nocardia tengchongensis]|uniref:hypothetical protein n=1 Tax=Nocardia tengchongensis TaxID=2055889 RepID=UPI0036D01E98
MGGGVVVVGGGGGAAVATDVMGGGLTPVSVLHTPFGGLTEPSGQVGFDGQSPLAGFTDPSAQVTGGFVVMH